MKCFSIKAVVMTCILSTVLVSHAQSVYSNPAEHLAETIANGEASGELRGKIAEMYQRLFNSDTPLLVHGKVLRSLNREGCKRIAVRLTKKDIHIQSTITDMVTNTEINYCLDGSMPPDDQAPSSTPAS